MSVVHLTFVPGVLMPPPVVVTIVVTLLVALLVGAAAGLVVNDLPIVYDTTGQAK